MTVGRTRETGSVRVNIQTTTRAGGTTRVVGTALVGVVVNESGADEVTAASIRVAIFLLVSQHLFVKSGDEQVDLDRSGRSQSGDGKEAGEMHSES